MSPSVEVAALAHRYASTPVLQDITFTLDPGTVVALAGPSGSGKSTLCHLVAGIEEPQQGTVCVLGSAPTSLRDWTRLALVPQQHGLVAGLTVWENVHLPLWRTDPSAKRPEILERLDIARYARRAVQETSLGEQQRVAIARALAGAPRVVVLDEPTGHQDDHQIDAVLGSLRHAADDGTTVVVATHDPDVLGIADRVLELRDGRLQ